MNAHFPTQIYANAPAAKVEAFRRFRETHPNRTLTVAGAQWRYIACGQGDETLLLLPGGSRFAEVWWQLIALLEDERRILSPSYPALATMAAHDQGLAAILDAEGVSEPVHVVGASFGGWLAQTFLRRYPQRVQSAVLSHTSGPQALSMGLLRLARVLTTIYPTSLVRLGLKRNILQTLAPPAGEKAFWEAFFHEALYLHTEKIHVRAQHAVTADFLTNYRFTPDDLAGWPGRLFIIESEDDRAFKPAVRQALRALYPQAQVHLFRQAGHSPGYTDPTEYVAVLKAFLSGA